MVGARPGELPRGGKKTEIPYRCSRRSISRGVFLHQRFLASKMKRGKLWGDSRSTRMFSSHSLSDRFRSKSVFSFEILVSLREFVGRLRRRLAWPRPSLRFKVWKARIRKCPRENFALTARIATLNLIKSDYPKENSRNSQPESRPRTIVVNWNFLAWRSRRNSCRILNGNRDKAKNFSPLTGVWQIFQRIPCLLLPPFPWFMWKFFHLLNPSASLWPESSESRRGRKILSH